MGYRLDGGSSRDQGNRSAGHGRRLQRGRRNTAPPSPPASMHVPSGRPGDRAGGQDRTSPMHSTVSPPLLVNIVGTNDRGRRPDSVGCGCRPGVAAPRVAAPVAADPGRRGRMFWSTLPCGTGAIAEPRSRPKDRGMPERRWRVTTGPGRGLFQIDVDDGLGFRPATTAEVDAALRQRELFGAADYPAREVGRDARSGVGLRNQRIDLPLRSPASVFSPAVEQKNRRRSRLAKARTSLCAGCGLVFHSWGPPLHV